MRKPKTPQSDMSKIEILNELLAIEFEIQSICLTMTDLEIQAGLNQMAA